MKKLKRTNANIINVLKQNKIRVTSNKVWTYLLEGTVSGQKINIGTNRLQSLITNGKLLPKYIKNSPNF